MSFEEGYPEVQISSKLNREGNVVINGKVRKKANYPFAEGIKESVREGEERLEKIKKDVKDMKRRADNIFESKDVEL